MPAVRIIGIGQTPYEAAKDHLSLQDLIFEGASRALADAGVDRTDLDSVVLGAQDVHDGRGIANMVSAGAAGAYLREEIRVAGDGIYAAIMAYIEILSGRSKLVLVISWSKGSESDPDTVTRTEFEPSVDRAVGLSEKSALALQAASLLMKYPEARRAATSVAVRDRRSATMRDLSHIRDPLDFDDVESSPTVAWPLTAMDLCPSSDGVCALVMASPEYVGPVRSKPGPEILGVGWSSDGYWLGDRDLTVSHSLSRAASTAYRQASVDPRSDIDVAEVVGRSTFQHIPLVEGLGFCGSGEGSDFLLDDGREAKLKINPSGGVLASNPYVAAGLVSVAEVALQLRGSASGYQLDGARIGLAHGSMGQCMQSNGVVVMRTVDARP